ncbi:MAG: efflux RND transporter periplasmic adaptor subunit [Acidobacteriota bacterium]
MTRTVFARTAMTRTALVLTALAALASAGCGSEPEAAPPAEEEPRPVRIAQARAADGSARAYSGAVRAAARSRLAFQVPGRMTDRPAELGAEVRGGQVLARLDPTDYRLRVERAQSAVASAEARLREAESAFGRVERLYADDNATRAQLDAALAGLEVARNAADAERRGLEIARRDLGHTRLTAPADGTVVDLFAEAGEVLAAGQAVATVARGGALELEWSVPESAVSGLATGQTVTARIAAIDAEVDAVISEVGTSPRDGGAAYPIRARLGGGDLRPLPGMAAEIRLSGDPDNAASGAVLLPPDAVTGDPGGYYVLVVVGGGGGGDGDGDGGLIRSVERRTVDVGTLRPEGLEVRAGLRAGETVVAAGVTFLADGQKVRLLRSNPLAELPPAVAATATADRSSGS